MTALPVTEICYASGFSRLKHFERSFKKKYGRAPGGLRIERNVRPDHMPTNSPGVGLCRGLFLLDGTANGPVRLKRMNIGHKP
ncbi:helix-turn-helix domain-containing protein [Paenibacillus thiaminolyticus]|uniref:helix-turn-helix domain-containing protein n=1 Tax=Paenibacillus thiaminolyticus TaxID=49283 RepID=UPI002176108E|nr:helix-turn-helix domain-containing protein [Paenibacillus thiaminolyticus]